MGQASFTASSKETPASTSCFVKKLCFSQTDIPKARPSSVKERAAPSPLTKQPLFDNSFTALVTDGTWCYCTNGSTTDCYRLDWDGQGRPTGLVLVESAL